MHARRYKNFTHASFEDGFDFRSTPRPSRRPVGLWEKVIIPRAAAIVASFSVAVTLRQLHYVLVSEYVGWYRNTLDDYSQLSRRTAELRRDGEFPALLDSTRGVSVNRSYESVSDALRGLADNYTRDYTEGQKVVPVLIAEKATLQGLLDSWFGNDLGLMVCALRGYQSESFEREIAAYLDPDRTWRAIYVGDFDPSGEDIERNAKKHLGWRFEDWTRVALSAEQVAQYRLPEALGKTRDARAQRFQAKHGRLVQVEVEALDPEILRGLIQAEIDTTWDEDAFQNTRDQEDKERKQLRRVADEFDKSNTSD